jgi:hypothetical protein
MDILSTHPLLAMALTLLMVYAAIGLVIYSLSPACGRHCTTARAWLAKTFTDPVKEDAKFVPPRTIVHREIDEPTFVILLPTPEQIERARKIADFEFETQVLPFRKPRRLEVN